jgi:signal peptidase I
MKKSYDRSGKPPYDRHKRQSYTLPTFALDLPDQTDTLDQRAPLQKPIPAREPEQRNSPLKRRPDRSAPTEPEARPMPKAAAEMPHKKPAAVTSTLKDLMFLLVKIAMISFVFVLLFTFLFGVVRYQDSSMDPAIKDGDVVLFFRTRAEKYHSRDVVILDFNGKRQVRRVVATAGDTVDITEDGVLINGALQQEQSIYQKTERYQEGVEFPLTVPEGHIFVLGDARKNATDSRIYGCVKISDTYGKAMAIIRRRGI